METAKTYRFQDAEIAIIGEALMEMPMKKSLAVYKALETQYLFNTKPEMFTKAVGQEVKQQVETAPVTEGTPV